ncbi:stress-inducible protein [Microtetraspora sp. NBRC 13810]|uniref:universal stress protein n=1 Tax=Microtetraspora sp. NBRC 13810 TaxID=3030990 RepID=UPI0024A1A12E|nr:universal stress protein [Microtetraspora sp. NBRC 13810]GLW09474.1 stress-inducible protein [Microtetraspora sp. NBRC 13810]
MEGYDPRRPVVAGYDGSAAGEAALRWAVQDARLRYAPLVICHAWQWPFAMPPSDISVMDAAQRLAAQVLRRGMWIARSLAPRLEIRTRLELGSAAGALLVETSSDELVVVGTHGPVAFGRLGGATTAAQVAAHAHCPVVVVGPAAAPPLRVIVGTDGSAADGQAIGCAFEEAALRRCALYAVRASVDMGGETRPAALRLQRAVAPWCVKYPDVQVVTALDSRPPHEAMLSVAGDSDLIVLGEPAPSGLGTTARTVLLHATCPVEVVHRAHPWTST